VATRSSINARSKDKERKVQQRLWPGSRFAGGAKRPALEDQDLCGRGKDGVLWWGEVKHYTKPTIMQEGGEYAVLCGAFQQCEEAIERNEELWSPERPRPFAVLWPVGSREDDRILAMCEIGGLRTAMTLRDFQETFIGIPKSTLPEADL